MTNEVISFDENIHLNGTDLSHIFSAGTIWIVLSTHSTSKYETGFGLKHTDCMIFFLSKNQSIFFKIISDVSDDTYLRIISSLVVTMHSNWYFDALSSSEATANFMSIFFKILRQVKKFSFIFQLSSVTMIDIFTL
jgi:hypothetical protein